MGRRMRRGVRLLSGGFLGCRGVEGCVMGWDVYGVMGCGMC